MPHFDSCKLTLIWLANITLTTVSRLTALPGVVSFLCWIGKCDILYQLICRAKTTGLSSEPARWSCDKCQRSSDFDSCQSNCTHTDGLHNWLVKLCKIYCDIWHRLTWIVCTGGREGVRYVITKFSRMDSLTNFVTYGAPMRALRVRESSAINSSVFKSLWA